MCVFVAGFEYRYFTRTIYQFQFQKALCDAAGHTDALSTCDITGSTAAGTKLRYDHYFFDYTLYLKKSFLPLQIHREIMFNFIFAVPYYIKLLWYTCSSNLSSSSIFSARNMLELGRSQSWTRALQTISGSVKMDASPLLAYFQKLHVWLQAENQKYSRTVGWNPSIDPCEYKRGWFVN